MPYQLIPALCLRSRQRVIKSIIITVLFSMLSNISHAIEADKRLLRVSVEMFPAALAADQNINNKQNSNKTLVLALVYDDDVVTAKNLAEQLSKVEVIKALPIQVKVITINALTNDFSSRLAGIFLTQQLETKELTSVIDYGIKHQTLVFSPFKSDVARGIPIGIIIENRILPYVNSLALSKAQLQLKPFFLRISKHYGE